MGRIPERALITKRGEVKDWRDVERALMRYLASRDGGVELAVREDAVQSALLRLVEYWQTLASSSDAQEPTMLAYEVAVSWGKRWAGQRVRDERTSAMREMKYIEQQTRLQEHGPGAEESVLDDDLSARARRVLEDLDPDELEDWFQHLLSPLSVRQQAELEHVNPNAVQKRRVRRRERAKKVARKHGLWF